MYSKDMNFKKILAGFLLTTTEREHLNIWIFLRVYDNCNRLVKTTHNSLSDRNKLIKFWAFYELNSDPINLIMKSSKNNKQNVMIFEARSLIWVNIKYKFIKRNSFARLEIQNLITDQTFVLGFVFWFFPFCPLWGCAGCAVSLMW